MVLSRGVYYRIRPFSSQVFILAGVRERCNLAIDNTAYRHALAFPPLPIRKHAGNKRVVGHGIARWREEQVVVAAARLPEVQLPAVDLWKGCIVHAQTEWADYVR